MAKRIESIAFLLIIGIAGAGCSGITADTNKSQSEFTHSQSPAAIKRGIRVSPLSPSGVNVDGNHWLLIVGIDTYIRWPRLSTAVYDAKAFRNVLLSRYHFDKNHLIELYDEVATRKNIIDRLRLLAGKVGEQDSLVIYFAGHGYLDPITKIGSWVPVESGVNEASTWISNQEIKNYLRVDVIKAKHILLISDSCFSGVFFRGNRGKLPEVTDSAIKKSYELISRQAITSGGLEPVSDEGFGKNSVFSYFLNNALKENQKPFLVPSDIFPEIRAGVAENADQLPRFGSLSGTGGQQGGELVFFLKQDSRLQELLAESDAKQKEIERLKKMEASATEARMKETQEIKDFEMRLSDLDAEINALRKLLGNLAPDTNDSLDALMALVHQKETQINRLKQLKIKRQKEELLRQREIEQLRAKNQKRLIQGLLDDIAKYKKIVASSLSRERKQTAWKYMSTKYAEWADDLATGDTEGLYFRVIGGVGAMGMKFVYIQPGTFVMGSPAVIYQKKVDPYDNRYHKQRYYKQNKSYYSKKSTGHYKYKGGYEKTVPAKIPSTQRQVTLTKGFYLQTSEITVAQWDAVMKKNPFNTSRLPATRVSWHEAQKFIQKLNRMAGKNLYRLPTEVEWEYACRAGSTTKYYHGDDEGRLDAYAWFLAGGTHAVQQKKPNAWGLYDMLGNASEWCQDRFNSDQRRTIRGGSWKYKAGDSHSALRLGRDPGTRADDIGFRIVRVR